MVLNKKSHTIFNVNKAMRLDTMSKKDDSNEELIEVDVGVESDPEEILEQNAQEESDSDPDPDPVALFRSKIQMLIAQDLDVVEDMAVDLYTELEETKKKRDDYLATAQRVQASFENFQKQQVRQQEWNKLLTKSDIIKKFLTIYDDIERTNENLSQNPKVKKAQEAVSMVFESLKTIFDNLGLEIINPENEKFNPKYHEAIHSIEMDDKKDQSIIEVSSKGFTLENLVVRPAKVVISRKKQVKTIKKSQEENENGE